MEPLVEMFTISISKSALQMAAFWKDSHGQRWRWLPFKWEDRGWLPQFMSCVLTSPELLAGWEEDRSFSGTRGQSHQHLSRLCKAAWLATQQPPPPRNKTSFVEACIVIAEPHTFQRWYRREAGCGIWGSGHSRAVSGVWERPGESRSSSISWFRPMF